MDSCSSAWRPGHRNPSRENHRPAAARHASKACRACRESPRSSQRSEEHTSELQSHVNLVCRLLLEKKKNEDVQVFLYDLERYHYYCFVYQICRGTIGSGRPLYEASRRFIISHFHVPQLLAPGCLKT